MKKFWMVLVLLAVALNFSASRAIAEEALVAPVTDEAVATVVDVEVDAAKDAANEAEKKKEEVQSQVEEVTAEEVTSEDTEFSSDLAMEGSALEGTQTAEMPDYLPEQAQY